MNSDWMDQLNEHDSLFDDDAEGSLYCPYTNGAECALLEKGWQVQELCKVLDCDQLKLFQNAGKRDQAA